MYITAELKPIGSLVNFAPQAVQPIQLSPVVMH